MADPQRVILLANKIFEADALMAALNARDLRPIGMPRPTSVSGTAGLRATCDAPGIHVEIWCLEEAMDDPTFTSADRSKSSNKILYLPKILSPPCALVVAFGTAATPWPDSFNRSVVIGSATLNHSPSFVAVDKQLLEAMQVDRLLASPRSTDFWKALNLTSRPIIDVAALRGLPGDVKSKLKNVEDLLANKPPKEWQGTVLLSQNLRPEIEAKMVKPPLNPGASPLLFVARNWLAISSVNVPSYDDFARADAESVGAGRSAADAVANVPAGEPASYQIGSVETTHGLIRLFSNTAAFLFISGITDRLGYFSAEVTPRAEAQNFTAALNAGIAAGYLIARLLSNPSLYFP
jgi:hypothetical protein